MSDNTSDHTPGAVELAAMTTVRELQDAGLMEGKHAVHAAAIVAAGRAVDEADGDAGKVAYGAAVLGKLLDQWCPAPSKAKMPSYMRPS